MLGCRARQNTASQYISKYSISPNGSFKLISELQILIWKCEAIPKINVVF